MHITEFWGWDAFDLQIGVTPISCVSLWPPLSLFMSAQSWQSGGGTFPLDLGVGCCIVLPQPSQCGLLLLLLLALLLKGGGLTKAGQLLWVSPALQGWLVEVDWGRESHTNPQGISVRGAEPWIREQHRTGLRDQTLEANRPHLSLCQPLSC